MTNKQIEFGLKNKTLDLQGWNKISHYSVVGYILMLPLIFIGYGVYQKIQYEYLPIIKQNEISFILVPVVIAALFFYIQKNRLKFVEIKTTKDKSEIDKIIKNTAKKLK